MFLLRKTRKSAYRTRTFASSDLEGQAIALEHDGFALVRNLLSPDWIEAGREGIDRLTPIHWDFTGDVDHYKCVFNRDPFWLPFLDMPGIIDLAEASLGADCHIIGQTAWRSKPGSRGVGVHADTLLVERPEDWPADREWRVPAFICTAHFYLSEITLDLCPTKVIPGSHRSGRCPRRGEESWMGNELVPVTCAAGDVLFFRSDVWHSGSHNTTVDRTRYLLQVHYGRRMIAQKFSPYLEWQFNPEVVECCSPRQRRLLGDHRRAAYD